MLVAGIPNQSRTPKSRSYRPYHHDHCCVTLDVSGPLWLRTLSFTYFSNSIFGFYFYKILVNKPQQNRIIFDCKIYGKILQLLHDFPRSEHSSSIINFRVIDLSAIQLMYKFFDAFNALSADELRNIVFVLYIAPSILTSFFKSRNIWPWPMTRWKSEQMSSVWTHFWWRIHWFLSYR